MKLCACVRACVRAPPLPPPLIGCAQQAVTRSRDQSFCLRRPANGATQGIRCAWFALRARPQSPRTIELSSSTFALNIVVFVPSLLCSSSSSSSMSTALQTAAASKQNASITRAQLDVILRSRSSRAAAAKEAAAAPKLQTDAAQTTTDN